MVVLLLWGALECTNFYWNRRRVGIFTVGSMERFMSCSNDSKASLVYVDEKFTEGQTCN